MKSSSTRAPVNEVFDCAHQSWTRVSKSSDAGVKTNRLMLPQSAPEGQIPDSQGKEIEKSSTAHRLVPRRQGDGDGRA